jgi:hypothetical protein
MIWGTRWRSWLRHRATSQKVAGLIPDGVTGIFYWHNPSGRTMALGLTQPLTEMSTRNIFERWRRPVRRTDNLTTFTCRLSRNLGASTSRNPQGLPRPVMGLFCLSVICDLCPRVRLPDCDYWRFRQLLNRNSLLINSNISEHVRSMRE